MPGVADLAFTPPLHALGYSEFRSGQLEALHALFRHRRLLLVAPTGGGKSLIYQLPATMLHGTTLVISPLIALMQDQVVALAQRGVPATYLASTLSDEEARARLRGIRAGEYRLVYVAPERLPYPGFQEMARDLDPPLIAIDEAHCISHWGHDFRRDYLEIGKFLKRFPSTMVLACTATATPAVRDDIVTQLGLGPDTPQILHGFARPNLSLRVLNVATADERRGGVDEALAEALGGPAAGDQKPGAVIIYCLSRADAETEAKRLRSEGWRAGWYHAGLPGDHRSEVQRRFMSGDLQVVAATNAFGMGIDRADVRAVIHLSPPDSVEAYYQEVGRAGRDGLDAFGLLVLRLADIPRRKSLIERSAGEEAASAEWVEHRWSMFRDLLRWAEGGTCRHDAILRYFGDEVETLHGCGRCDVCLELVEGGVRGDGEGAAAATGDGQLARGEEIALTMLSAVRLVDRRLGLKVTVKLLRGEADDRLTRYGLAKQREFGALSKHSETWLSLVLQRCVTAGWVDFTDGEYPLLMLTPLGAAVLEGKRPARMVLPPVETPGRRPATTRDRRGVARRAAGAEGARSWAAGSPRPAGLPGAFGDERPAGYSTRFDALRRWRLERARADSVPAFVVASDRTLDDIATLNPSTLEQLKLCYGIGPSKVEKYGAEILQTLRRAAAA